MIRTFKDELRGLVRLHKDSIHLDFEPAHAASYNELVEIVQRNLLLADFGEANHEESLLNKNNTKWATEMLRNVHLSCCVAGNCYLTVNEEQLADTLFKLAKRNGYSTEFLKEDPWRVPCYHPLHTVDEALRFGGICQACNDPVRLPLVTPCAHLLCQSCTKRNRHHCFVCGVAYRMQLPDDAARLEHNASPQLPVPIEVIEWQPSYAQSGAVGKSGGGWQPNWFATRSSKCSRLVQRLNEIGIMDSTSTTKAIVFTRFSLHLLLIEHSLKSANIPHCILKRDTPSREKNLIVNGFRTEDRRVLIMDVTGAVGLDLSMASWVFLMEPLMDRSVEEQIISRAHRMGAACDVHVEVMVMRGSVEEMTTHCLENNTGADKTEDTTVIRNALIGGLKRVRTQ